MFLDKIQFFFLKKKFIKRLRSYRLQSSDAPITTIGIIVDESNKEYKNTLLQLLTAYNFKKENITFLVYKNPFSKDNPSFSNKGFTIFGTIKNSEAKEFISTPFDMLLNFYTKNSLYLQTVTQQSEAYFKVGLGNNEEQLNHLYIVSKSEEEREIIDELIKYLKILKKI